MKPPTSRAELVDVLQKARLQKGWSLRRAAGTAGVAHSTVQGWFDGRHLPTHALTSDFLNLAEALELIDGVEEREEWGGALGAIRGVPTPKEAPYVGLRPYSTADTALYFGRERAYSELVAACLRGDREGLITVIVIGDSGAGKSSLLAAGLVGGALGQGGPLEGLVPCWVEPADLPSFSPPEEPCLILVDQFEEAQKLPEEEQKAIFDALAGLPAHATVVVALTADAFGFAMRDDRLARHLDTHVRVASLSEDEYRRIIEEPARLRGRPVTPALTDLLVYDMGLYGEPRPATVLPLLSSVLRRCWDAAGGDTLKTRDYLRTGGLWGAVDGTAEDVYGAIDEEQRPLVQRLMLSLVRVEGTQILRRRIPVDAVDDELRGIADRFEAARLLVRRDGQLAIAHDALLRHWERLKGWVEEASASLLIGRRIHMATQLWDESGRSSDALRPAEAELWHTWSEGEGTPLLSDLEREFIELSREQAAVEATRQHDTIRRMRNRLAIAVVAGVLACVMAAGALLAGGRAEAATRSAQGRQIALVADDIRNITPNIAGQLSVAALSLDDSVETRSAVVKSAGMPMPERATGPAGNTMVALTDRGDIVRGDSSGTVTIWRDGDLSSTPLTFASGGGQIFALQATNLNGRDLVFVGGQQTAGVWDITNEPRSLGDFGADTVVYSATWQAGTVLFGTLEGQVRRVDVTDAAAPSVLDPIQLGDEVAVTAVAATGHLVIAGGRAGVLDLYSWADGAHLGEEPVAGTVLSLSLSPNNGQVVAGTTSNVAGLWTIDADGLRDAVTWDLPASVNSVLHRGSTVLVAGSFTAVHEYGLDGSLRRQWPERTVTVSIAALDDAMVVGATEGVATLWDTSADDVVFRYTEGRLFDVIPGSDSVLFGSNRGPRVFDRDAGGWRQLPLRTDETVELNAYYGLSDHGGTLVNQTRDGRLLTFHREADSFVQVDDIALPEALADLRVSPSGRYLALGIQGKVGYRLLHWGGETWEEIGTVDAWPGGAAFVGDSVFAAMGVNGQDFSVWSLDGAAEPTHLTQVDMLDDEVPVGFAGASGLLAVGDSAGEITVYSLRNPVEPEVRFVLHDARSSISQLSFSADTKRLLASTREGLVWAWDVSADEAELMLRLEPDAAGVQGVAEYDGWILMTLSDGRARAWPTDPSEVGRDLCSRFGEELTEDEWLRLVPGVPFIQGCG